jgi:rubrerythrin
MPGFGSPFSGLANDRKLTDEELVRAIRFMVAAEYEAIQLYMQLAESTDNKLAVEVLKDIAGEARVDAGEFLRLLRQLAPDEEKFYAKGAKEVEEEIKKLKLRIPGKNRPTTVSGGRLRLAALGSSPLKRKPLSIKKKRRL